MQAVCVISTVGKDILCRQAADQITGGRHIILLAGAEIEAHRQAQGINYGMDFGSEAATGAAEGLGLRSPLLRRPPAA